MADEIKTMENEAAEGRNFIHAFIDEDIAAGGQYEGMTVHTRFPPEPNGYLHIGHCKAVIIDFGTAEKYGGLCNLRMDDTNPAKEDTEYVDAIQEDIHWLGFDWGDRFYYGSDYFEKTYELAVGLIKKGLAYVCELTPEQFKEYRGSIGVPARSPWRDRPIEENLELFERMKNGEFPEGSKTLRAKIDLASGNFNMRDPVIYRIRYIEHHRQGTKWCIFPMYDFAHPIQDALEGITHSLCSLEYEDHRPLYNWVIDNTDVPSKPRQIEFARLGIDHTVMSKRKLRQLVEEKYVSGWDDPRMPTLCGLRRRGYTPKSIRNFCERIGVAKTPSTVDYGFLEHCLREDLNENAERTMAVLRPIALTVTNYPEGQCETFEVENNPVHPEQGTHTVTFSRHIYIEADDFLETPVPKYKRLYPPDAVILEVPFLPEQAEAHLFQHVLTPGVGHQGVGVQDGDVQLPEHIFHRQLFGPRSEAPVLVPGVPHGKAHGGAFARLDVFEDQLPHQLIAVHDGEGDALQIGLLPDIPVHPPGVIGVGGVRPWVQVQVRVVLVLPEIVVVHLRRHGHQAHCPGISPF